MGKSRSALLFWSVVALVAYPPLATVWEQGLQGAFRYFATDAFYYFAVADNSAGAPFYTFDGTHPTNGFHPLWQYALTAAFEMLELSADGQLLFALLAGVALTALGSGLFGLALLRLTDRLALAWLGAVPGVYFLLLSFVDPHYLSQWAFINGMESPLTVFFFGLLTYLLLDRSLLHPQPMRGGILAVSGVITLVTLSRLDDVFLFAPFLVYLAATAPDRRRALERVALASAIPTLAIGGYLAFNLWYAGVAFPVSGATKSEGLVWGLLRNTYALGTTLFPFADLRDAPGAFWSSEAWRVLQMVVPALGAAFWMLRNPPRRGHESLEASDHRNSMVFLLAAYVLLKAAYNFALVRLWHQGHWYFPASIMTFNLIAVTLAARWLDATPREAGVRASALSRQRLAGSTGLLASVGVALFLILVANGFVHLKRSGRIGLGNHELWRNRASIQRALDERCPGCGIVAFDDGIFAYSLSSPVMSGLGLALDPEAADARAEGRLLEIAHARGYRLLTSLNYPLPEASHADSTTLRRRLEGYQPLRGEDLDPWEFTPAYVDPDTGIAFTRFEPRPRREVRGGS